MTKNGSQGHGVHQVNRKEGKRREIFSKTFCVFWLAGLSYVGSTASKEQISLLQNQFSYNYLQRSVSFVSFHSLCFVKEFVPTPPRRKESLASSTARHRH